MELVFHGGTSVGFDKNALNAVNEQIAGKAVTRSAKTTDAAGAVDVARKNGGFDTQTYRQQLEQSGKANKDIKPASAVAVEVELKTNAVNITAINGGQVKIRVALREDPEAVKRYSALPNGTESAMNAKTYYANPNSSAEEVPSRITTEQTEDGEVTVEATTPHLSEYVIMLADNSYESCQKGKACVCTPFADLDPAEWYHDGVHFCVGCGLMNGVSETQFAPAAPVTRAQVVTMIYRLEGEVPFMNDNVFSDVAHGSWYERAAVWVDGKGVFRATRTARSARRVRPQEPRPRR